MMYYKDTNKPFSAERSQKSSASMGAPLHFLLIAPED